MELYISRKQEDLSAQPFAEALKDSFRIIHEKLDMMRTGPLRDACAHLQTALRAIQRGCPAGANASKQSEYRAEMLHWLHLAQSEAVKGFNLLGDKPYLQCIKVQLTAEYLKNGPCRTFFEEAQAMLRVMHTLPLLRSAIVTQAQGGSALGNRKDPCSCCWRSSCLCMKQIGQTSQH